ncbi:MAG: sugar phosphate isomerase/epimerase [Clostridiales bacterium]|nr:sugar phosphate isomerase/epimerase [Clostridiales bacterium]
MDNQLGVYYAFLASSDEVNWLDCLRRARAAGLDILEMSAPKLRLVCDQSRREIAARAADLGMQLTFATALTLETDVSDPSPAIRMAGIKRLREDIQLVRSMGGTALGGILTGVGKHFSPGVELTRDEAVDRAISSLREAAKTAEDEGVTLCVEVVNRFESPLVNTCLEGLRVAEAVDSPALGVHLDTFHMNIEEANIGNAIRTAGKHLVHFHACENNRALPPQGHINWNEVFEALQAIDYQGPIVMEALPGPYGSVAGRLNIWRKLSQDVDGELTTAVSFLRERMEDTYGI